MASKESDRLNAVPPGKFTAARDDLVCELRAKGDAEGAKSVAKLRKPHVALWMANQLARLAPADVDALIEATARLQRGQTGAARSSADDLREAMRMQREVLARLAAAAGRAAQEAETQLTPALQRRVQNTVQAAAASEPQSLREGRLESELQPSGFDGLLGASPPAPGESSHEEAPHPPPRPEAAAERARKKEEAAREQAKRKAEQEAHRLDALAKKLEQRAAAREEEATRARQEADEARRKADEAAARARNVK